MATGVETTASGGLAAILREAVARFDVELLASQALEIWTSGGWAMLALAANALILFVLGMGTYLQLRRRLGSRVPEQTWRRWIGSPDERRGPIGKTIGFVMEARDLEELHVRFNELHTTETAPFERDLRFMKRAVSTAPLLGLLGTVTGMLTTFGALAGGGGGDQTMDMIAGGISEALITTETGLMIALPGLFFQYHLTRMRDRYDAFLAHLETVCAQHMYRHLNRRKEVA